MDILSMAIVIMGASYLFAQTLKAVLWLLVAIVLFVIEVRNDFIRNKNLQTFETFKNE